MFQIREPHPRQAIFIASPVLLRNVYLSLFLIFRITVVEGRAGSFQYINRQMVDSWILDGAADVPHPIPLGLVDTAMDDLISVAHNCQVWIVSHDNHLSPLARFTQTWDERVKDRLVVEVLFGLVNDERIIALVDEKIEDQQ